MPGYSDFFKDSALDTLLVGMFASLHDDDPGNTGANEITGGAPAYARIAVVFDPASGGVKAATTQPIFDVPAGVTVKYGGLWDALSGGNFFGSGLITPFEIFAGQGTFEVTALAADLNAT